MVSEGRRAVGTERRRKFAAWTFKHSPCQRFKVADAMAYEDRSNLVSVIIPTYNREHCIAQAIESALGQTHRNVEIIVIDDGSTDGTATRIEKRYQGDDRVNYIHQPNGGVSAARNRGLRAATGAYIALLDSDDVWKPWKIELQLRCLRHFPAAGMIWTDMEAVDPEGRLVEARHLRTMYKASYRWFPSPMALFDQSEPLEPLCPVNTPGAPAARVYCGDISSQMVMGNLVHTSTVMLRRQRLEAVGGFDEALGRTGEDFDFHLRTCQAGPVAFADIASIKYRVGADDQLSSPKFSLQIAQNFLRTIEPSLDRARVKVDLTPSMRAAVQAEAHRWIGHEMLVAGDPKGARVHFLQSLRHQAVQPITIALLMLTLGPSSTYPTLRSISRSARHWVNHNARPVTRRLRQLSR